LRRNRSVAAREAATRAVEHFKQLAQDGRSERGRILWAHGEALCGNWLAAEQVLRAGLAEQSLPAYRTALANLYVNWAASSDGAPGSTPSRRFGLLLQALQLDPAHRTAIARMAALIEQAGDGVADLESQLKQALARGTSAPVLHEMLGTLAAQQARFESARFHLEQALRGKGVRPQTLNNLAWVLVRCEQPDPDRALELINKAQSINPRLTELRETRGEILLRLGRWAAAVSDLESVLVVRPQRSRLHVLLAEAYDGLGETGTADHHRRLAQAAAGGG
jgi:Tfp pilus assembly protein PilF